MEDFSFGTVSSESGANAPDSFFVSSGGFGGDASPLNYTPRKKSYNKSKLSWFSRTYTSKAELSRLFDGTRTGAALQRVYSTIKHTKNFGGRVDLKNRGKIKMAADAINMPVRSFRSNVKKLVEKELLIPHDHGGWALEHRGQIALEQGGGARRVHFNPDCVMSAKASLNYLYEASITGAIDTYEKTRSVTPNYLFLPNVIRVDDDVMSYVRKGKAVYYSPKQDKKQWLVKNYTPMANGYLATMLPRASSTISERKKAFKSVKFRRVLWKVDGLSSKEVIYLERAFTDLLSKEEEYGCVIQKVFSGKSWVAFEIASHCVSSLPCRGRNIPDDYSKELDRDLKKNLSMLERHSFHTGLSTSHLKQLIKGRPSPPD